MDQRTLTTHLFNISLSCEGRLARLGLPGWIRLVETLLGNCGGGEKRVVVGGGDSLRVLQQAGHHRAGGRGGGLDVFVPGSTKNYFYEELMIILT